MIKARRFDNDYFLNDHDFRPIVPMDTRKSSSNLPCLRLDDKPDNSLIC